MEKIHNFLYDTITDSSYFLEVTSINYLDGDIKFYLNNCVDMINDKEAQKKAAYMFVKTIDGAEAKYNKLSLFKVLTKEGKNLRLVKKQRPVIDCYIETLEAEQQKLMQKRSHYIEESKKQKQKHIDNFIGYLQKLFISRGLDSSQFDFEFNCFKDYEKCTEEELTERLKAELTEKIKTISLGKEIELIPNLLPVVDSEGIVRQVAPVMFQHNDHIPAHYDKKDIDQFIKQAKEGLINTGIEKEETKGKKVKIIVKKYNI